MKKSIYLLNIGDYAPEITALTYPWIERYACKIRADIHVIRERKFPEWDLDYEKLQIYELAQQRGDEWSLYIDSDALVHPELVDLTELIPRDTVAHNGSDFANIRFAYDRFYRRDGRNIGSCNWFALASAWCIELWKPLDDLTMAEAVANITPTVEERNAHVCAAHLVSDYALSRNIAKYGLKFTTLNQLWSKLGMAPSFFWHVYTLPADEKLIEMRKIIASWKLS